MTKDLDVNPGEVIVGVNIQEIGFRGGREAYKENGRGYNKEDGDYGEFHIGSIQFQLMQLGQTTKHLITP